MEFTCSFIPAFAPICHALVSAWAHTRKTKDSPGSAGGFMQFDGSGGNLRRRKAKVATVPPHPGPTAIELGVRR